MRRVAEYEQHAKDCRALAASSVRPDDKVVFEEIAKVWDKIAARFRRAQRTNSRLLCCVWNFHLSRCQFHLSGSTPKKVNYASVRTEMIKPDRLELLIAALVSALLGIVTGYVVGKPSFGTLIWALIGAVVVGGAFYCYRAFR